MIWVCFLYIILCGYTTFLNRLLVSLATSSAADQICNIGKFLKFSNIWKFAFEKIWCVIRANEKNLNVSFSRNINGHYSNAKKNILKVLSVLEKVWQIMNLSINHCLELTMEVMKNANFLLKNYWQWWLS